jgi:hypothetical protein
VRRKNDRGTFLSPPRYPAPISSRASLCFLFHALSLPERRTTPNQVNRCHPAPISSAEVRSAAYLTRFQPDQADSRTFTLPWTRRPGERRPDGIQDIGGSIFCGASAAEAGGLLLPRCSLPFGSGRPDALQGGLPETALMPSAFYVWLDHLPMLAWSVCFFRTCYLDGERDEVGLELMAWVNREMGASAVKPP